MSKIKVLKPVVEETGKFVKTAGEQITGTSSKTSEKDETKEFVKSLYGKSSTLQVKPDQKKAEDELAKKRLRQELHAQYYQRLVNPPKAPEEKPAEKVEREKKQEMVDLQQKEKKKPPVLVQRAAQRVEKYPGASG